MGGGRGAFFRSPLQQQRQRRRRRRKRRVLSPPTQLPCILLLLLFYRHRPSTFGLSQDHGWRRRRRLRGTRKGALPEQTGREGLATQRERREGGVCCLLPILLSATYERSILPFPLLLLLYVPSLILLVRNFPPRAFLALFPGKSRGKKVVLAVGTTLRKEGKCLPQFPFSSLFRVGTEDGFFELRSVGRTPSPTLILPFFRPPLSGGARALEGGGSFPPPPPKGGREVPQPVT